MGVDLAAFIGLGTVLKTPTADGTSNQAILTDGAKALRFDTVLQNVIDDDDPVLGGYLYTNDNNIVISDSNLIGGAYGMLGRVPSESAIWLGHSNGSYDPNDGAIKFSAGETEIGGSVLNLNTFTDPVANTLRQMVVTKDGSLGVLDFPPVGWELTATDVTDTDLGEGIAEGAWVALPNLEVTSLVEVLTGERYTLSANIKVVNTKGAGTLIASFGIDGAQPTGAGIAKAISNGFDGVVPYTISSTAIADRPVGTVFKIWVKRGAATGGGFSANWNIQIQDWDNSDGDARDREGSIRFRHVDSDGTDREGLLNAVLPGWAITYPGYSGEVTKVNARNNDTEFDKLPASYGTAAVGLVSFGPTFDLLLDGTTRPHELFVSVPGGDGGGGGGGMVIGAPVIGGGANRALFVGPSGNLADSPNFTYDGDSLTLTEVTSGTSPLTLISTSSATNSILEAFDSFGQRRARILYSGEFYNSGLGSGNSLYGSRAGRNITGFGNVAIGSNAGLNLVDADSNIIIGNAACSESSVLQRTVCIGDGAGPQDPTANSVANVIIGEVAGTGITTGSRNMMIGRQSGREITTGGDNTLIGERSGVSDTGDAIVNGVHNVCVGTRTGVADDDNNAVAIGAYSIGRRNSFVSGSSVATVDNVYFGKGVFDASPTAWTLNGTANTTLNGDGGNIQLTGGAPNGTGDYGFIKLLNLPTADPLVSNVLWNDSGTIRTSPYTPGGGGGGMAIGDPVVGSSPDRVLFTDASSNLAESAGFRYDGATLTLDGGAIADVKLSVAAVVGQTANLLEVFDENAVLRTRITAQGEVSDRGVADISTFTVYGVNTGRKITTGSNSTFFGTLIASSLTDVIDATLVGFEAGSALGETTSAVNYSTLIGARVGRMLNSSAGYNTSVGANSLLQTTAGARNSCLGYTAGREISTGSDNTVLGHGAGYTGGSILTGSSNTCVGVSTSVASPADSFAIAIGAETLSTSNAFVAGSTNGPIDNVYFGKGSTDSAPTAWTLNGTANITTDGDGGDLQFSAGLPNGTGAFGSLKFLNLPTTDPAVTDAIWNDAGTLRLSPFDGTVPIDTPVGDPANPVVNGRAVMWVSDGTALGDIGDVLMKVRSGGTTKTVTVVKFNLA